MGVLNLNHIFSIDRWGRGGVTFYCLKICSSRLTIKEGVGSKIIIYPSQKWGEGLINGQKILYFPSITPNSKTIAVCHVGWLQLWLFAPWCFFIDTI